MTPKQQFIEGEFSSALEGINDYLREEKAEFALSERTISTVKFVFPPYSDRQQLDIPLSEEVVPDKYLAGRIVGRIYHKAHNQEFTIAQPTNKTDAARKEKVERTIEHIFAMLNHLRDEQDLLLEDLEELASAKDPKTKYSIMFDAHKEEAPQKSGKKPSPQSKTFEYYADESRTIQDEIIRRKKEDDKFDSNKKTEFGKDVSFETPDELKKYSSHEGKGGVSDDPLDIALAKTQHEEFTIARIVLEGRGEDNWKKVIPKILNADIREATLYLQKLLQY